MPPTTLRLCAALRPAPLHLRKLALSSGLALCLVLAACGGGGSDTASASDSPSPSPALATLVDVGDSLFNDVSLSASGRQSCASCHVEAQGHADPLGTALPLGGPALNLQGLRSSLSANYLNDAPTFRLNAGRPVGGLMWDGRVDNRVQQAALPLLSPTEMANASVADAATRLRRAASFADLIRLSGLTATASDQAVFNAATRAIAIYQEQDADYQLFNSKFDLVQDGLASFTAQEARGQALFNDPARGACSRCHASTPGVDGSRPLFTDFTYHSLGLPRNRAIAANADPSFFDMGLCGPVRTDLAARTELCGLFRVPTLRNVALTGPYFHNAVIGTLDDAVSFYATRESNPARWYPLVGGVPDKFNDLPIAFRGNVEQNAPFNRSPDGGVRLSPGEVADVVAFLRTLTDDRSAPARSAFVGR